LLLQWLPGWTDIDLGDYEMAKTTVLLSQIIEVLRRIMWNLYRVEWQCVKEDPDCKARLAGVEGLTFDDTTDTVSDCLLDNDLFLDDTTEVLSADAENETFDRPSAL
jgi:hypothetical protein